MYKIIFESMNDRDVAEELINEAFIKIINNYETVRNLNRYQQAFYHIRTVKSVMRKHLKDRETYVDDEDILGSLDYEINNKSVRSAEELCIDKVGVDLIVRCMKELKPRDSLVIWARYYLGMTEGEIEKAFGIKARQVHVFLARAKNRLIKRINEEEKNGKD